MSATFYPLTQRQPPRNPTLVFFHATVAYVLLLSAAAATGSGALKLLANAAAIGSFVLVAVNWLFLPSSGVSSSRFALALCLYYAGMGGALIVGFDRHETIDLLKMLMAPAFVAFGAAFEAQRPRWPWQHASTRLAFALLVLLPLAAWGVQLATGATTLAGGREVGMFANRNNAGLYAMTLLALYTVLSGQPLRSAFVFLGVGVLFGTLGVLVAVVLALLVTAGRWRNFGALLLAVALFALALWSLPEVGVFARIRPLLDSLRLLVDGRIDLQTVSYADLVRLLHTTDLSFLFRLKHWLGLLHLYAEGTPYQWAFGFGLGASVRLSDVHLVPHNDYLRLLFECGLVTLLGFVTLLLSAFTAIGRRWELVPLLVVGFYFASENLVNNYLAMSVFWFSAGALATRIREARHAASDH